MKFFGLDITRGVTPPTQKAAGKTLLPQAALAWLAGEAAKDASRKGRKGKHGTKNNVLTDLNLIIRSRRVEPRHLELGSVGKLQSQKVGLSVG